MMINKTILKIAHFFGFRKDEEHISDVTINVDISCFDKSTDDYFDEEFDNFRYNFHDRNYQTDSHEYIVNYIKDKIRESFIKDPKLQKRCQKTHQVWVTLYKHIENIPKRPVMSGSSRMDMIYYDDGILFYPKHDQESYERHKKLKEIGI